MSIFPPGIQKIWKDIFNAEARNSSNLTTHTNTYKNDTKKKTSEHKQYTLTEIQMVKTINAMLYSNYSNGWK